MKKTSEKLENPGRYERIVRGISVDYRRFRWGETENESG